MLELPETTTLAAQMNSTLTGRKVISVLAAASPHKFAWYQGDPTDYPTQINGNTILSAEAHGMFIQVNLSESILLFSDGVNLKWHPAAGEVPAKHQLLLGLNDGTSLSACIAMYGGLLCYRKATVPDNPYYLIACKKPSPLTEDFSEAYFDQLLSSEGVRKLSLKAALATEQRIPGLGNGCLQDILWQAGLHPKRKVSTLTSQDVTSLYTTLKHTLKEMSRLGGRDTEKDLLGNPGGYPVVMSAKNNGKPCPKCGCPITKEAYLGGSIYTCQTCQNN